MDEDEKFLQFHQMGLDDRILEAIARLKWEEPTPIQEKAIPLFLQGKDVFARSRTGSGKSGAFLIPVIHKILEQRTKLKKPVISAIIIAPSKELCKQICDHIQQLTLLCKREVKYVDLSQQVPIEAQKVLLAHNPDIVIGTPFKFSSHISGKSLHFAKSLEYLIIDEADLMFAYSHEKELKDVLRHLPRICQSFITSATLPNDVKVLKDQILHKPVMLKLEESPLPPEGQLTQYLVKIQEFDKATLLYAVLRLSLIKGKILIFVNTVNKGYKIRLFLGIFGIQSCILNSELPVTSRCDVVDKFNGGKYDILIASDEKSVHDPSTVKGGKKPIRKVKTDRESGVSRGIDFQSVSAVVNFDFPGDVTSYIHRVGRTARASMEGTALSFVSDLEMKNLQAVEKGLKRLSTSKKSPFMDYKFNMDSLSGFRYRTMDAWKQCTTVAVRDFRKRELKSELLNSQKLKTFFDEHPNDLETIRHDVRGKSLKTASHLKNVPFYNIPSVLRRGSVVERGTTQSGVNWNARQRFKRRQKHVGKANDPLRTLAFEASKK